MVDLNRLSRLRRLTMGDRTAAPLSVAERFAQDAIQRGLAARGAAPAPDPQLAEPSVASQGAPVVQRPGGPLTNPPVATPGISPNAPAPSEGGGAFGPGTLSGAEFSAAAENMFSGEVDEDDSRSIGDRISLAGAQALAQQPEGSVFAALGELIQGGVIGRAEAQAKAKEAGRKAFVNTAIAGYRETGDAIKYLAPLQAMGEHRLAEGLERNAREEREFQFEQLESERDHLLDLKRDAREDEKFSFTQQVKAVEIQMARDREEFDRWSAKQRLAQGWQGLELQAARDQVAVAQEMLERDQAGAKQTATLLGQFNNDQVVKESREIAQAYGRVLASVEDPSAAGDVSLVFAYMKMLDPGSVVREGEQATAKNAGSVPERIRGRYNQALRGESFSPVIRADFLDRAGKLAGQSQKQLQSTITRYDSLAEKTGADASVATYDPFEGFELEPAAGAAGDPDVTDEELFGTFPQLRPRR